MEQMLQITYKYLLDILAYLLRSIHMFNWVTLLLNPFCHMKICHPGVQYFMGEGTHIAFGADPVGVPIALRLCVIFCTSGWILIKLALIHCWEGQVD